MCGADVSFRTELSVATAAAFVRIARSLGVQLTYVGRGTSISVWGIPKSSGGQSAKVTMGVRSVERRRKFDIPTQAGFPPVRGLTTDDTITDEHGNSYRVEEWNNSDDIGAVYAFEGVYTKTKQVGAVGQ